MRAPHVDPDKVFVVEWMGDQYSGEFGRVLDIADGSDECVFGDRVILVGWHFSITWLHSN